MHSQANLSQTAIATTQSRSRQVSLDLTADGVLPAQDSVNAAALLFRSFEKFYNVLIEFDYSVHSTELRIDDVFVNHFNKHLFNEAKDLAAFNTAKKESFARAIIDRLTQKSTLDDPYSASGN